MSAHSTPAQVGSDFVAGILEHLGVRARLTATDAGDGDVVVALDGDLGRLEGNPELVAAIAQLAGQAVSQAIEARARVQLDLGNGVVTETAAPRGREGREGRDARGPRPEREGRDARGPRPEREGRAPAPPASPAREQFLGELAAEIAEIVNRTGRRAVIEGLSSPERRIVHTALMDHGDVNTHSEGSEAHRYLLVEPNG